MMCICLYFTYLGWRVIYFCSKASQMTQPKKYMKRIIDGSFLIYCIKKPHREYYAKESVEFDGGGNLQILNRVLLLLLEVIISHDSLQI